MDLVIINVGGKNFSTHKSTLLKSDFFKSYFERWTTKDNIIFLDLDPKIFIHVLNLLRDSNYEIPTKYYNNVYAMATYLCVGINVPKICEEKNNTQRISCIDDIQSCAQYGCYRYDLFKCAKIIDISIKNVYLSHFDIYIKRDNNQTHICAMNNFVFEKNGTMKKKYITEINNLISNEDLNISFTTIKNSEFELNIVYVTIN